MVSFDDPASFAAKGRFIAQNGLRGYAMWEAGGDSKDMLIDAIRTSAGF
jgi:chitinase